MLYLLGVVPSLLLLLLSARIVLLLHEHGKATSAYAAGDFEQARDLFEENQVLNPVERWVAPFGEGDARFGDDDLEGAVSAFEKALELVPPEHECLVRLNLALAHEEVGDRLADDGDPAAADAWQAGREALAGCRPQDTPQDRTQDRVQVAAAEVDARLVRKLGGDQDVDSRPPDEAPPADKATREKERRLTERNKRAHEENVDHQDEFDPDAEPTPPPDQPPPTPQW